MDEHFNHRHHAPPHRHLIRYFRDNLAIALGLVLIWRGIWYALDEIDNVLVGGNHIVTALPWFIIGILILYLPDRDLKEIQKL